LEERPEAEPDDDEPRDGVPDAREPAREDDA
jgi:hypothetical protein